VAGCDDDPLTDEFPPAAVETVENLPADPATGVDPNTGRGTGYTNRFTLYSLREHRIVPNADSASTQWDLAFRGTTILTNSGTSGPGQGGARIVAAPFEQVAEAPSDDAFLVDAAGAPATAGSDAGDWYNYNPTTHVVTPAPGRTL